MKFPPGQFGVILADPPWQYQMYSEKGYEKSPDAHYSCMVLDQIKAMRDDILFSAAPNCVCVMWTVWPMMNQALDLMESWGFQFKTGGDWNKTTKTGKQAFGTGYVLRSATEPFIIGTIGKPRIKNHSTRNSLFTDDAPENLNDLGVSITSQRREHSRKPDEMIVLIEELFDGPYLELFSRQKRPGWESWGNQTDKFGEAA